MYLNFHISIYPYICICKIAQMIPETLETHDIIETPEILETHETLETPEILRTSDILETPEILETP